MSGQDDEIAKKNFLTSTLERRQNNKERIRALKKAYLSRPDVQEKLEQLKSKKKEIYAKRRKKLAEARREKNRSEKLALRESQKAAREKRQKNRDIELQESIRKGSDLPGVDVSKSKAQPIHGLTVIQGGRSLLNEKS